MSDPELQLLPLALSYTKLCIILLCYEEPAHTLMSDSIIDN